MMSLASSELFQPSSLAVRRWQNTFFPSALDRFSFARPAENPRRYWAGWQFRISRGWLHRDLQELQDLFLLGCWEAILIEFSAIDRDAIARDLR
jgi:hypothetical protein